MASAASIATPVVPAPKVARRLVSSRSCSPAVAAMSTVMSGRSDGRAVTPPTTLVPPPNGRSAAPVRAARAISPAAAAASGGRATASGTTPSRPLRSAIQSGRLWPRACRTRTSGSTSRRASGSSRENGTALTTDSSVASCGGVPRPISASRSSPARRGSWVSTSSGPQPFHRRTDRSRRLDGEAGQGISIGLISWK